MSQQAIALAPASEGLARLRAEAAAHGQRAVAERLGISRALLSMTLARKRAVSLEVRCKVESAFGIPAASFDQAPPAPAGPPPRSAPVTAANPRQPNEADVEAGRVPERARSLVVDQIARLQRMLSRADAESNVTACLKIEAELRAAAKDLARMNAEFMERADETRFLQSAKWAEIQDVIWGSLESTLRGTPYLEQVVHRMAVALFDFDIRKGEVCPPEEHREIDRIRAGLSQ